MPYDNKNIIFSQAVLRLFPVIFLAIVSTAGGAETDSAKQETVPGRGIYTILPDGSLKRFDIPRMSPRVSTRIEDRGELAKRGSPSVSLRAISKVRQSLRRLSSHASQGAAAQIDGLDRRVEARLSGGRIEFSIVRSGIPLLSKNRGLLDSDLLWETDRYLFVPTFNHSLGLHPFDFPAPYSITHRANIRPFYVATLPLPTWRNRWSAPLMPPHLRDMPFNTEFSMQPDVSSPAWPVERIAMDRSFGQAPLQSSDFTGARARDIETMKAPDLLDHSRYAQPIKMQLPTFTERRSFETGWKSPRMATVRSFNTGRDHLFRERPFDSSLSRPMTVTTPMPTLTERHSFETGWKSPRMATVRSFNTGRDHLFRERPFDSSLSRPMTVTTPIANRSLAAPIYYRTGWGQELRQGASSDLRNWGVEALVSPFIPKPIGNFRTAYEIGKGLFGQQKPPMNPNQAIDQLKPIAALGGPSGALLVPVVKTYWGMVFDTMDSIQIPSAQHIQPAPFNTYSPPPSAFSSEMNVLSREK